MELDGDGSDSMRVVESPELPTDGTFVCDAIDDPRLLSDPKSHFGGNPTTGSGIDEDGTDAMDDNPRLGVYDGNEVRRRSACAPPLLYPAKTQPVAPGA